MQYLFDLSYCTFVKTLRRSTTLAEVGEALRSEEVETVEKEWVYEGSAGEVQDALTNSLGEPESDLWYRDQAHGFYEERINVEPGNRKSTQRITVSRRVPAPVRYVVYLLLVLTPLQVFTGGDLWPFYVGVSLILVGPRINSPCSGARAVGPRAFRPVSGMVLLATVATVAAAIVPQIPLHQPLATLGVAVVVLFIGTDLALRTTVSHPSQGPSSSLFRTYLRMYFWIVSSLLLLLLVLAVFGNLTGLLVETADVTIPPEESTLPAVIPDESLANAFLFGGAAMAATLSVGLTMLHLLTFKTLSDRQAQLAGACGRGELQRPSRYMLGASFTLLGSIAVVIGILSVAFLSYVLGIEWFVSKISLVAIERLLPAVHSADASMHESARWFVLSLGESVSGPNWTVMMGMVLVSLLPLVFGLAVALVSQFHVSLTVRRYRTRGKSLNVDVPETVRVVDERAACVQPVATLGTKEILVTEAATEALSDDELRAAVYQAYHRLDARDPIYGLIWQLVGAPLGGKVPLLALEGPDRLDRRADKVARSQVSNRAFEGALRTLEQAKRTGPTWHIEYLPIFYSSVIAPPARKTQSQTGMIAVLRNPLQGLGRMLRNLIRWYCRKDTIHALRPTVDRRVDDKSMA